MSGKPTYEELEQRVLELERVESERKRTEEALLQNEAKYRSLTERMNDILWTADLGMNTTYVSPSIEKVLGFTVEERLNQPLQEQMPPETLLLAADRLTEELKLDEERDPERYTSLELNYYHKDGALRCLETTLSFVRDEYGKPAGIHGISRDITDRKDAEEALRESENRHRFITEWMTDIVWIMDLDLRTTYVSPSVTRMLGFTPEERMKQEATEILTPESYSKVMSCFAREINKEEKEDPDPARSVNIDAEFYHKDGHTVWMESVVRPIRDHNGSIIGIHGVSRDITERRLAEAELRLSEEKASKAAQEWRITFNAANDAIWILDQDQRIVLANQTAERLFNRSLTDLVGKHCFEIVHGTAQPIPECPLLKAEASLRRERMELQIGEGWFEVTVDPILDAAGRYAGVVHFVRDITERNHALEALRESERKFRTLADNIPEVVYLCRNDERHSMSYLNSRVEELTGYAREEFLEDRVSFVALYHPEDKPTIIQAVNDALARREPFHLVYRLRRRDRLYRWVEEWGIGVYDGDELKYLEGLVADITRRKEAEQALQESETKYKFLAENTADVIFKVNVETEQYTYVSPSVGNLIGYSVEEVLSLRVKDVLTAGSYAKQLSSMQESIAGGRMEPRILELDAVHKDGHVFPVEIHSAFVLDERGRPVEILGVARDITERLELEQRRRQIVKTEGLNRMAGAIAHHFNNMLHIVTGNLELALENLALSSRDSEDLGDYLNEAMQGARNAAEMSTFMLTYAGQSREKIEVHDLSEVCEGTVAGLQEAIPPNIRLVTDYSYSPELPANVAPDLVRQALTHLVTNALEAIGETDGEVRISLKTIQGMHISTTAIWPPDWDAVADKYAVLQVADTGHGIHAEDIDLVMDPFFSTKFTGRGIGLPFVLGIALAHEGAVIVKSKPGVGSTFQVLFPLAGAKVAPKLKTGIDSAAPMEMMGGLILLVEDEELVRKMVGSILKRLGFDVVFARNGVEAVDIFRTRADEICLVITDLTMPRMDGWETLAALRKICPDVRVILTSGYDEASAMAADCPEKPQAFLHKPFEMKTLQEILERVFGLDKLH